jgi:predicted ribosome quality control (RQC) complex YloA/Tae2 family protein
MDDRTIEIITDEIKMTLSSASVGRVFQLSRSSLVIQFRAARGDHFLFISIESADPRLYIIRRRVAELEKISIQLSPFALALRKHLGGAILAEAMKDVADRIVRLTFEASDDTGEKVERTLIIQLTGRSSNLFLLDEAKRIIDALRRLSASSENEASAETKLDIGDVYVVPFSSQPLQNEKKSKKISQFDLSAFNTVSEAADAFYTARDTTAAFDARARVLLSSVSQEIEKRRKLRKNLERDLEAAGDATSHRRIGELLLANASTAEREGARVRVADYYAENAPVIEIEIDEQRTIQEEAAHRFARYAKAKRAAQEIGARIEIINRELAQLDARRKQIERVVASRDAAALEALDETKLGKPRDPAPRTEREKKSVRQKSGEKNTPRTHTFLSSDGYEIIVGRGGRENDYVTFRLARPHDLWLHAADYPGAHVVVRNHSPKKEIPQRTVIEAAQIAAFSSKARDDAKVAVHYTARKFVSKPKGAAPGLVRLSSFRTLLVEPRDGAHLKRTA